MPRKDGGASSIERTSSAMESSRNGGRPAKSSNKITPSAQMSVRGSTSRAERICSGDMYSGEPIIAKSWVSAKLVALSVVALETPKSRIFTTRDPSGKVAKNRFAGFKSRCTMPDLCASAMASLACST